MILTCIKTSTMQNLTSLLATLNISYTYNRVTGIKVNDEYFDQVMSWARQINSSIKVNMADLSIDVCPIKGQKLFKK